MVSELHFAPDESLEARLEVVTTALLVPFDDKRPSRRPQLGGVVREDGSFVQASRMYLSETRPKSRPPHPASMSCEQVRKGTWLFAGRHDNRFGHFLVESLSRLWGLDHAGEDVAGIAFTPKKVLPAGRVAAQFKQTLNLLALVPDLPKVEVFTQPTRFENLVVPPQGCGAVKMAPGCPEFRSFIRVRFAPHVKGEGGSKLYISRTKLINTPGQILFEQVIENAARDEGYEIFHPQDHSLEEQIARYRAATHILGVEGSAFHLLAFACPQEAKIGFIRRRTGDAPAGFAQQISQFTGRPCCDLDFVRDQFFVPGQHQMANGILDLEQLFEALSDNGFFYKDHTVPPYRPDAIAAEQKRFTQRVVRRQ